MTTQIKLPDTLVAPGGPFRLRKSNEYLNSISFHGAGEEMLRVGPDGFYVRGKKIDQDDTEAQVVYNSFKEWLIWQQLNRD